MSFRRTGTHRILCLALAFVTLFGMLVFPMSAPADAAGRTGTVNVSDGVNVRSGPNTSSSIVISLGYNTRVTIVNSVTGQTITSGSQSSDIWYQINYTYNGTVMTGYICSLFITVSSDYTSWAGVITNVVSTVNIRKGASTSYDIVASLAKGTEVTVTNEVDGAAVNDGGSSSVWYQISFSSSGSTLTGYVSSLYVTKKTSSEGGSSSGGSSGVGTSAPAGENTAFETELAAFPSSYQSALRALHQAYPAWHFKAQALGYDWEYAVGLEYRDSISVVSSASPSSWKCCESYGFDWETGKWYPVDSGAWVCASREIIEYYMDPRNFLDSTNVFQFLAMSFDGSTQTVPGVQAILNGTFMEGEMPDEPGTTYAECIYEASRAYGANPYVIAAKLKGEQGINGSVMVDGTYPGYEGYSNFFNYGASGNGSAAVIANGLEYAKKQGWDTRRKSIEGGTEKYVAGYISNGQDTTYLTRFEFSDSTPCTHQYASAIHYAQYEGSSISKIYSSTDKAQALSFSIPVFKNMPSAACSCPSGNASLYIKLKSLSASTGSLSPRFQPDILSYTLTLPDGASSANITPTAMDGQATVTGGGTCKTGDTVSVKVTARDGSTRTYTVTVTGGTAVSEPPVDPDPPANPDPVITPFGLTVSPDGDIITLASTINVADLSETIVQGGYVGVYVDGKIRTGAQQVATGNVVVLYDDYDESHGAYRVVLKGDVNKDGAVDQGDIDTMFALCSSGDADTLQILAGDMDGDGDMDLQDISIMNLSH